MNEEPSDLLVQQAAELMILGMGTVFLFLALLVLSTGLMSRSLKRFAPQELEASAGPSPVRSQETTLDPSLRRAIELAVQHYRKEHG